MTLVNPDLDLKAKVDRIRLHFGNQTTIDVEVEDYTYDFIRPTDPMEPGVVRNLEFRCKQGVMTPAKPAPTIPTESALRLLESTFGADFPWDDSVQRTAERFCAFLEEYAPGPGDPEDNECELPFNFTCFRSNVNQMIMIRDIEYSSICKHHLLPFVGKMHVAYLPNKLMVGASKIPRLVDWVARRPHTQELLTAQVADQLKHRTEAQGVAVLAVATHTCMACRGVRKVGASMVTSEMRGAFLSNAAAREEFMMSISL